MYRVNLVVICLLSMAVIATAFYFAIGDNDDDGKAALRERIFYRLGHSDPDIVRDVMEEVRNMGLDAIALLNDATSSKDRLLAKRADRLLAELTGGKPDPTFAIKGSEEPSEKIVDPQPAQQGVAVHLQAPETKVVQGGTVQFYVRWINDGPVPVQVARERVRNLSSWARFARFEIVDSEGKIVHVPADDWRELIDGVEPEVEFTAIHPGQTLDLYAGQDNGGTSLTLDLAPGRYTVRFVYDAGEESDYRKVIALSNLHANWLPVGKVVSNEVTIIVATAH